MSEYEWNPPKRNGVKSHKIPTQIHHGAKKKGLVTVSFSNLYTTWTGSGGFNLPFVVYHGPLLSPSPIWAQNRTVKSWSSNRSEGDVAMIFLFWTIPWLKHLPSDKHSDRWNIYIYIHIYIYIYIFIVIYYTIYILYYILYYMCILIFYYISPLSRKEILPTSSFRVSNDFPASCLS